MITTNFQEAYLNFFLDIFEDIFPNRKIAAELPPKCGEKFKEKIKFLQENHHGNFIFQEPKRINLSTLKKSLVEDAQLKKIGVGWGY